MIVRLAVLVLFALISSTAAQADYRVFCQQGAAVVSAFVRNDSKFPVRVEVTPPGGPTYTITNTSQLPPQAKCAATGTVTFLADASTDNGKSYHRVMSRTADQPDGSWLVEVAPDTFNGNFAYSAQFRVQVKAAR